MAAIGNLNDYVKFQMAEGMTKGGGEGGGMASTAAGLGRRPGDGPADDGRDECARKPHRRRSGPAGAPPVIGRNP